MDPLRVIAVAEHDAIFRFQLIQSSFVSDVASFPVRDGEVQGLLPSLAWCVKGQSTVTTSSGIVRQTNLRSALRTSAPGNNPHSVST